MNYREIELPTPQIDPVAAFALRVKDGRAVRALAVPDSLSDPFEAVTVAADVGKNDLAPARRFYAIEELRSGLV